MVPSFLDILIGFYCFCCTEPCQIRVMCVMFPVFSCFCFREVARSLIFLPHGFFQSIRMKLMNVNHSSYLGKSTVMEQPLLGVRFYNIKGSWYGPWKRGNFSPIWKNERVWDWCIVQMWGPSPSCTQKSVWWTSEAYPWSGGASIRGFPCLNLALLQHTWWFQTPEPFTNRVSQMTVMKWR